MKKLPIETNIPKYLVQMAMETDASKGQKAIVDLTLIAFYYLLRVGDYTCRQRCNEEKQTVQFRIKDVTFFRRDKQGRLQKLPWNATSDKIMAVDSCTLKLSNQKNGWRGVCINHHANGNPIMCPVRATGQRYIHITVNR